jgi:hypothetical protein
MAQAIAFQAALQRIGFTQPAVAAMTANGITTIQDLIGLDDKDDEQILKIIRVGTRPYLCLTSHKSALTFYVTGPQGAID